ncbi:hypothetical protein JCM11641_003622 [Rhodosporidiobolus odoratus]
MVLLTEPAALAEVRTHFDLLDDTLSCNFTQRFRGKSYIIAPSAWQEVEKEAELELVVVKKEPKVEAPPAVPVEMIARGARPPSPARRSGSVPSPPPQQPQPPSQPRSSQHSAIFVPATPEHTDNSDEEISDSDEREARLSSDGYWPTPRQTFFVHPASSPVSPRDRRRSPSPSPSNYPERAAAELLRVKKEEQEEVRATSALRRPRERQHAPIAGPSQPRPGQHLAAQTPKHRHYAVDQTQSHSPARPTSAQPPRPSPPFDQDQGLHPAQNQSARPSWAIGLDSTGEPAFVERSPGQATESVLDKGKGKAPPTPSPDPEGTGADEEDGERTCMKPDSLSCPDRQPSTASTFSYSSSSSEPAIPRLATTAVKLSASQPMPALARGVAADAPSSLAGSSSTQARSPQACAQATATEEVASRVDLTCSQKRRAPSASPPRPRKRAAIDSSSTTTAGQREISTPSEGSHVSRSTPDNEDAAACTSSIATRSQEDTSTFSSSSSSFSLPFSHPQLVAAASAALALAPSSQPIAFASPRSSVSLKPPSASQPTPSSRSRTKSPRKPLRPRPSAAVKLEQDRLAALARPRVSIVNVNASSRFRMWVRLTNWPIAPFNTNRRIMEFGPLYTRQIGPRGADGGLKMKISYVFEDAKKATLWEIKEMRFTFCPGTDREKKVWGFDNVIANWKSLEEMGCRNGEAVDVDWVEFDEDRSVFDEE